MKFKFVYLRKPIKKNIWKQFTFLLYWNAKNIIVSAGYKLENKLII